jgi:hypothetical protein
MSPDWRLFSGNNPVNSEVCARRMPMSPTKVGSGHHLHRNLGLTPQANLCPALRASSSREPGRTTLLFIHSQLEELGRVQVANLSCRLRREQPTPLLHLEQQAFDLVLFLQVVELVLERVGAGKLGLSLADRLRTHDFVLHSIKARR